MTAVEEGFTFEAALEEDGLKVANSPGGRTTRWAAELDHAGHEPRDPRAPRRRLLFDLNVEYFIGMPSWVAAGDPPTGSG